MISLQSVVWDWGEGGCVSGAGVVGRGCLGRGGDVEVVKVHLFGEGRHLHLDLTGENRRTSVMETIHTWNTAESR